MKKIILFIFIITAGIKALPQAQPTALPNKINTKYTWYTQYLRSDSGLIFPNRDTIVKLIGPGLTYYNNRVSYFNPDLNHWTPLPNYSEAGANSDSVWRTSGNTFSIDADLWKLGTRSNHKLRFITNDSDRIYIPSYGISRDDTSTEVVMQILDTVTKRWAYRSIPTGSGTFVDSVKSSNDSLYYYIAGTAYFIKKVQPYGSYLTNTTGWSTTGNSGTTPGTNFLGTTDSVDFVIKTNNTERIRVLAAGNVGIGTSTPAKIFHTVGTVRMASLGTSSSDTTTNKPVGINSSGDVIPMTYWPGGGGGGNSSIPNNIFFTSDYGLVSDADLSYGSSTFGTNNTDSIQYILNQASSSNPILVIVNGKYSATQLKIKSNTHILVLPGCGFIQRDNSNVQFVVNYNRSTTIIDSNITIEGGIWNFDGWRGTAKQNQAASNGWVVGFRFAGVRNLIVRDVILYNSRTFASFVSKAENVLYENILIKAELQNNQDGLKFLVGDNITVKNIKGISMGDDILSICSNDIFWIDTTGQSNCSGAGQIAVDSFAVYGNLTNVYADKIEGDGSKYGIRLLSSTDSVKNITINNVMGTFQSQGVIIDNYTDCPAAIYGNGGTSVGYFDKIVFNNLNQKITTTSVYKSCSFYLNAKVDNLTLRDIVNSYTATNDLPYFRTASNANIGNLKIEGYYQKDSINGNFMFYNNNGTITNFSLSNSTIDRYNVSDTTNTDYPFLYNQNGTITHLTLNNVSTNKVKYLVDIQGGAITTINAANVYHRTTNTAAGAINIATSLTTDTLVMSNYNGKLPVSGSGTITTRLGDAFSASSISGTTNYIPKFTSSSTVGNSNAYDNSGEILINTTSDGGDFKLQVAGDVYLPPNGTSARTISWGTGYDRTALLLYDGGAGVRHGWGLRSSEMQFFNPTGAHFSWNKGGDFQVSGTNELMRLDCTTGNLSVGATSASAKAHIISTTEQLRLGYDGSNYASFTTSSTGNLTIGLTGTTPKTTFSQAVKVPDEAFDASGWNGNVEVPTKNAIRDAFVDFIGTGTYLPTASDFTNVGDTTLYTCQYSWVKDPTSGLTVATVSGKIDIDPTSTGNTELYITLPITTSFTLEEQAGGTGAAGNIDQGKDGGIAIKAVTSQSKVKITFQTTDTANHAIAFSFTYKVTPP